MCYVFDPDENDIGAYLSAASKKWGLVVGMRENGRNLVATQ